MKGLNKNLNISSDTKDNISYLSNKSTALFLQMKESPSIKSAIYMNINYWYNLLNERFSLHGLNDQIFPPTSITLFFLPAIYPIPNILGKRKMEKEKKNQIARRKELAQQAVTSCLGLFGML